MSIAATAVPDLLRRFMPTPHKVCVSIGHIGVELQTNDLDIVSKMQRLASLTSTGASGVHLLVKVIRDEVHDDGQDLALLSSGPLTILSQGTRTSMILDRERHELLGFLAASVSAERFVDVLLPLMLNQFGMLLSPAKLSKADRVS